MSYLRGLKPRWYVDSLSWLVSRGAALDVGVTTGAAFNTGSTAYDLVDQRVNLPCSFDTSGDTTQDVDIDIDLNNAAIKTNFVAILGHNIYTANGFVEIYTSTDGTTWGLPEECALVVGDAVYGGGGTILNPGTDGSHIVTLDDAPTKRYIRIKIKEDTAFSGTDLFISQVLVGQYYDLPHALDNSIKRGYEFKGNKISESRGGNRFSTATQLDQRNENAPFRAQSSAQETQQGGRLVYSGKITYLDDQDLLVTDQAVGDDGDLDTISKVQNRLGGSHLPFIWTPDSTSTTVGDYMYARMTKFDFPERQAHRAYNIGLKIEQEF